MDMTMTIVGVVALAWVLYRKYGYGMTWMGAIGLTKE